MEWNDDQVSIGWLGRLLGVRSLFLLGTRQGIEPKRFQPWTLEEVWEDGSCEVWLCWGIATVGMVPHKANQQDVHVVDQLRINPNLRHPLPPSRPFASRTRHAFLPFEKRRRSPV